MLRELFEKHPYIIINSDLDGFLSGMLLQNYCGCQVVGISNSREFVWIDPNYEKSVAGKNPLYTPIYIDLFVENPITICIDQHIVAVDEAHRQILKGFKTKINPNVIDPGRTFLGSYSAKYPFGTIHFLIAFLERNGIKVVLPNLKGKIGSKINNIDITIGDILLRADDALYTSLSSYRENAIDWWIRLLKWSKNADSISDMIRYVYSCDQSKASEVKSAIGEYFKKSFNCKNDGGFGNILDNGGKLRKEALSFRDALSRIFGMPLDLPVQYAIHQGIVEDDFYKNSYGNSINASKYFSHAFIKGPKSQGYNFSYTHNLK